MSIQEKTEAEQTKAPTVSVPVNLVRLSKVGQRPDFLDYLVQLWDRRSFIFFDARARVQSGNDKTHLGIRLARPDSSAERPQFLPDLWRVPGHQQGH